MRTPLRLLSVVCALLLGVAAAQAQTSPLLLTDVPLSAFAPPLERSIPVLMRDGDVPGLSLAVVRGGRIFWQHAFGVRDAATGALVQEDTVFEAASLSKTVFAYAVLKLVDAGVIDLDTPIVKYLPGDYSPDPRVRAVTPRSVLSHTTGFPNWRSGRELEMLAGPGERFGYSGEGFDYLQKAVERGTGQTMTALMQRLVFVPLDMTSSSYAWEDRFESRIATGHDAFGAPLTRQRPTDAQAAATLHTTIGDYARFLIAVLDGTGLSQKMRAEMLKPQVWVNDGCQGCDSGAPTGRLSKEVAWGLGWGLQETSDGVSIWHWGDNGSGFHCYVVGYPSRRLGVVVFTNGLDGHGIIPDILAETVGGQQPAIAWLSYERWNSPARKLYTDILARGPEALESVRKQSASTGSSGAKLTETQVNRVGYWLLGKKKTKDAIAVFEMNVADFPGSWNVYDSLGEAYADDGQREKAITSYEKSLALNPKNDNGVEALKKLKSSS